VTLRERASSAVGLRAASAPSLSRERGFSIESARDAMIVLGLVSMLLAASAADTVSVPVRADSVIVLPVVRVDRPRIASDARRRLPTASVSELATGNSGRAFETLAEVLGEAVGVRVQQYGGLGAFSTVSLRGAPPGQVTIFLDGSPLTSAAHGVVSLSDLPATAIERIEVYRGLSPLGFGAASPGGAINLVTTSSPGLRELRLARGAFGTWEARAGGAGQRGALTGRVHAGYQGSRGDFRYPDDNGTPFNLDDDSLSTRVNNRFDAAAVLASLAWQPGPGWRLAAREDLFRKAQGIPGLGAVPAYASHLEFTRALSQLEIVRAEAGSASSARLHAGLARERTRFRDPLAELGLGRHDTDDHVGGEDVALELEWSRLPRGLAVTTIGSLRQERSRPSDAAAGVADPPPSRRLGVGAGAIVQWRPLGERVLLHAGLRRDRLDDRLHWVEAGGIAASSDVRRTLDAPQLGVRVMAPHHVVLRSNWADARRAPDFLELFGNQGSVLGNPALLPERARSWDLGGGWSRALPGGLATSVELAHFSSRTEDLVVYMRHSQSSVRAENISRARIDGEEFSVRVEAPGGLGVTGGFTRMSTRDAGPVPFWAGRRLPLRPAAQGSLRLDWRFATFRAVADLQYIGDDFLDRANLQRVPDRLLAGASLSFTPHGGGLRLTVEGKNLGDDRVSDVGGFPLPGRALFASCDLLLGVTERHPK
jgi:iron complex outermembrane receptor protein